MYAYEAKDYRLADDPQSTRGKYNTHHPREDPTVPQEEIVSFGEDVALAPTPSRDFGPFFVQFAPFRGTLLPVGYKEKPIGAGGKPEPGQLVRVRGCVVGLPERRGLPYATLDVWQCSPDSAAYDYEEKDGVFKPYLSYIGEMNSHSQSKEYAWRARVLCDHRGRFEYVTAIPCPYMDPEDNTWRCPHIHHFVQPAAEAPHASIVTQIMFPDMDKNDVDNHIRPDLVHQLFLAPSGLYWETADVRFVLLPKQ